MWIHNNKTWHSEEEVKELKEKLKQVQNDYYSMVDKYEDLKEKYKMAVNQNNELYKRYDSLIKREV